MTRKAKAPRRASPIQRADEIAAIDAYLASRGASKIEPKEQHRQSSL